MNHRPEHLETQGRREFLKAFGTSMAGISLSGIFPGTEVFGAAPASAPPCTSAGSARLSSRPQSQSPPLSMLSPARSTPTSAPSAGNTRR